MTQPRRSQLLLPLLETLQEAGGTAKIRDVYDRVAEKLGLDDFERHRTITSGSQQGSFFERSLRWQRQSSVQKLMVAAGGRGTWSLTDLGAGRLANARPGVLLTIFETRFGKALWGSMEAALGVIEPESIDLIYTSPPYPNCGKTYLNGELDEKSWVDFMLDAILSFSPKMRQTGSMMLNVSETYRKGEPVKSEHISRLRVRLADETRFRVLDRLVWSNSSALPRPFSFVAKRRIRLKPGAEEILWISEHPEHAEADSRRILAPYSRSMLRNLSGERRYKQDGRHSGGLRFSSGGFAVDNGGSIPSNVMVFGAAGGSREYYRGAREDGLPVHPAVMPQALAEHCIRFATQPGGLVVDPMAGSLTTAAAAEKLGRDWLCSDVSLAYVAGGRHRFTDRREDAHAIASMLEAARTAR